MSTETIVDTYELAQFFFGRGNETDNAEILALAGSEAAPGLKALDDRIEEIEDNGIDALDVQDDGSSRRVDDIELAIVGIWEVLTAHDERNRGMNRVALVEAAGDNTITESTFTTLGLADLELYEVRTGDVLMFTSNFIWEATAETAYLDLLISGSANFVSSGTSTALTSGIKGWEGTVSVRAVSGGPFFYRVKAADVVDDTVSGVFGSFKCDVMGRTAAAGDKLIEGGANDKIQFAVVNLSH